MNEATYVTGVVIANGVPDSDGDCLDKKDIKTIFTKYLNRDTDVMHTRIKNEGVEVLANWITETDTEINGKIVPSGSWMATFAVTNEELLSSIKDGSISGISLGSVSEEAMTKKYWFINKSIHYEDLDDMEEVIPLFISFVDKGANQYGLQIEDYNIYINKNDKTGGNMTNEDKTEDAMIPISALGKLKDIFSINKNQDDTDEKPDDVDINKDETIDDTAPEGDVTNKELLEQLPALLKTAVVEAFKEVAETKTDDSTIDKADDNDEDDDDSDDVEINKNEDKDDDSTEDETDDVEINKRQTSMTDVVVDTTSSSDFYKRTGRDHLGRKIRS
ncbi:MAG: hypothetical protein IJH12_02040 [Clostridia bacterium]|nr:hypothetical protein [Clostridia bacterium]